MRTWRDYRLWRDSPTVIRYVGWLGHRNVGDEALFQSFKTELCPRALLLPHDDLSLLSAWTRCWRPRVTVLGGGTLINVDPYLDPLEKAIAAGEQIMVFGTGVADLEFWSEYPGMGRGQAERWLRVLRCASYIGVRGPQSLRWLVDNGIQNAEIIGDPALSVATPLAPKQKAEAGIVGVNLGSHDPVTGGQEGVSDAVCALIRYVLSRGRQVRYLSLNDIDHRLGLALHARIDDPAFRVVPFSPDVSRTVRDISDCDMLVGQRLHATVLASALSVPNLSLSYQPKCLDFLESIDCEDLAVPTRDITAGELIDRFEALAAELDEQRHRLGERCDHFRQLQSARAHAFGWA